MKPSTFRSIIPASMKRMLARFGLGVAVATGIGMAGQDAAHANPQQEFLQEYAKKDGVKVTESGLQYRVLRKGTGEQPTAWNQVEVHYKGTLIDGTQFDSSYDRGQTATFPLTRVIPGWTEGLQLMQEGAKYEFVIPSDLAYGAYGQGDIPPGATLIFEVELFKVVK